MIQITPSAMSEIKRLQLSRQQVNSFCRLDVEVGGCSGMYYKLHFVQEEQPDDIKSTSADITFLFSPRHRIHLENLKLDYVEDLMGGTFRFDNPSATMTCRCGLSFA